MPDIEVQLPAAIGDVVLIHGGELAGQGAMVVSWRLVRSRVLLGGSLDQAPWLSLQLIIAEGDNLWRDAAEVIGLGAPALVSVFLPFMGGDQVLVKPTAARGEIRGWMVNGLRVETVVVYRVHLAGTPTGHEMEVNAYDLEPQ